jgi:hypothetical protein
MLTNRACCRGKDLSCYVNHLIYNLFYLPVSFFLFRRFKKITLKTFSAKFTKTESIITEKYYRPGVHSDDTTGAHGENDHPLHVRLFLEYIRWKEENPAVRRTVDHNTRDARRITGQSIVGAQPPLGEEGQMLRTEITRLNRSDLQHLASRTIGEEIIGNVSGNEVPSSNNINQEENRLALVGTNRARPRSLTPPPPRRVRSNISSNADNHNVTMNNMATSFLHVARSFAPSYDSMLASFQAAQAMYEQAQQDGNEIVQSFAEETMLSLRYEMKNRRPSTEGNDGNN